MKSSVRDVSSLFHRTYGLSENRKSRLLLVWFSDLLKCISQKKLGESEYVLLGL